MSRNIPFEIQVEIIKRLPIKSLIQFRSVSKPWKSVIDSADFIADYTLHSHAQPQRLLIRHGNYSSEETYVSIVDDDTFPQNKFSPTVPPSVDVLWDSFLVGSSHGLVCLFGYHRNPGDVKFFSGTAMAVLWNLSIRKSVAIAVPGVVGWPSGTVFGFGVFPATSDPRIVKISDRKMKSVSCSSRRQVDVFSLSSGVWRSSFGNLPDTLDHSKWSHSQSQVTIHEFIYWLGIGIGIGTGSRFLVSFNLSSEEFREIYLPNKLASNDPNELYLFNRSDSVAVLKGWIMQNIYEVWVMENGDSKSFTKLFTVNLPDNDISISPLGFRRNGELMLRVTDDTEFSEALVVYESFSEHINDLGIKDHYIPLVSSYTESLILLNQSDTQIQ